MFRTSLATSNHLTGLTPSSACLVGLAALALGFSLPAAEVQAAPVVTEGCDLEPTLKAAVRYRNLSNQGGGEKEIYIGTNTSTVSVGDVTWSGSKEVTFTYDGINPLTTTVPDSSPSPVAKNVGYLGDLNYLQITIQKNTQNSSINLNDVSLNSASLVAEGGFVKATNTQGTTCWRVTGIDMGSGFELTGTLEMTGRFGAGDSNHVQIDVGYVIPPSPPLPSDMVGPVTLNVSVTPDPVYLNGYATVTATVDDTITGGSKIKSAEYMLNNNGHWLSMAAKDGDFDEVSEVVEITFDALEVGKHKVCVRGTDEFNNVGVGASAETCQYFLVTYKYDGFFSPINDSPINDDVQVVNVAKAGQTIPVKWRLTDYYGVPIDNPASFTGLFSSQRFCDGGQTDPVEESNAAGKSGLQYIGDGYWQFNWKTDKNLANTCRGMYVEFDSGATSRVVRFRFSK